VQIQRDELKQKIKRGVELDQEKILKEVLEEMQMLPFVKEPAQSKVSAVEMDALCVLAYHQSGQFKQAAFTLLGFEGEIYQDRRSGSEIADVISKASPAVKSWLLRAFMMNQFRQSPDPGSLTAGACMHLAQEWCPDFLTNVRAHQEEVRTRREAKINKQLEDLEQQIAEAQKQ
jgi:hypothetical protein